MQAPNGKSAQEGNRGGVGGSRIHGPGRETGRASAVPSGPTGSTSEAGSGAPEEPRPRRRRPPLWLRAAYKRLVPLLSRVSVNLRIRPPPPPNIDRDEDRFSALPDDVLRGILERLDLHEVVRARAVSTRWRHLPHLLPRLHLDVRHFVGDNSAVLITGNSPVADVMEAFTGALCSLLSACPPPAQCKCAIKTLSLRFFPMSDLSSIGHAVEDVVARGEIECLEFHTCSPYSLRTGFNTEGLRAELGQLFMSFSGACPVAFRWLTMLKFNEV
ncbi:uncharacterized protein [Triticum aestivum]|uniref:uncharacterized protein n=1 Tax=Triticum aestivum TaxID=4565 RepID=UPI001D0096EA|nr:uncharacterized protein LOC123165883 [Triticum aestivum]XP_044439563.1 uncharacterized protein LOC123165883 [Triticum aestivum]